MSKPDQEAMQERHFQLITGEGARERLLMDLPLIERRVQLHGISTAMLEGGDGPPVVLLHGPGGHAASWLRVIPNLVATYRVIAPDLPGQGASESLDGGFDAGQTLAWLDGVINCTCTTPPAVVGHALGGAIAARFASEHSEKLNTLVLVDALGLAEFQPSPDFGQALSEFLTKPTGDTHDRLWSYCAFDLDTMRDRMGERWEWLKAYNLDRANASNLRTVQRRLMERFGIPVIPAEDLACISVPTSIIWGRHDRATPLSVAQVTSARFGWPLHVIEHCADDPPLEQPEAFLEALRTALANSGRNVVSNTPKHDARSAWDNIAPGYDRTVTPTHMWLGHEGLRRAGVRAGIRFLDVAAGSGALSLPAARLGVQVLATDQSPVMLELLEVRARHEGLDIETRVMDGHQLELADGSFDMVGSQFGVMLFPDMPKGIREMARVVKNGGRVLMTVLGDPSKIEFFSFLIDAVQSVRPEFKGPSMNPPPLPFQLQDPEELRKELAAAGLKDVKIETIAERLEFRSGKDLWDWQVSSNPIVETLLGSLNLTKHERGIIRQTLDRMVQERRGEGGLAVLTVPINIGVAMK